MLPTSFFSHQKKDERAIGRSSRPTPTPCRLSRLFWRVGVAVLLSIVLSVDMLSTLPVAAAPHVVAAKLPLPQANFTLQNFLKQGHPYQPKDAPLILSKNPPSPPRGVGTPKKLSTQPPQSWEPASMKAVSQSLSATATPIATTTTVTASVGTAPLHLVGSDAVGVRLELLIPAGAIDLTQAKTTTGTAPQGALTITLTQQHGHAVGMTNELGSFLIQITDANGAVVHGLQLKSPMTFTYHYRAKELYLMDLNPAKVLLVWPELLAAAGTTTAGKTTASSAVVKMTNNATSSTLTATSTVLDSSAVAVGVSDPANQTPAKPRFATVQGNSGQLNYSYPLTVAPGPKGTAPSLALAYSSAASNGRTSPRSPAENTGEGWALTMGSISEEKEAGGSIWYFLNGVDNVSDRLIPDSTTIQTGTNFATEHLSYLKVGMVNAGFDSQQCFHVWDTSGNYYEFGCTTNALQYYTDSSGNRTNYRYDLDQFIPANEGPGSATRILNASYLADSETDSGGHTSMTDAVLKQITYGTSTSADISNHKTTTVSGTVDFFYKGANSNTDSNGVQWVTAYGNNEGGCVLPSDYHNPTDGTNTTNERCDDPRGKTSGLDDPLVMSKFSLQTVKTYVGTDSSTSHLDYSYAFTYQDTAFSTCTDGLTGTAAYCAGSHLLTAITPTVYQAGTGHALPGMSFGYNDPATEHRTNSYEDTSNIAYGSTDYKMQTNWRYLISYHDHSNGVGAQIVYHTAYNNSNGTPSISGDNRYDPLFCVWNSSSCTGNAYAPTYNKMWTQQVVYQITTVGKDSSAASLTPATTTYHYLLATTTGTCTADTATPPNSNCVGFGWIPSTSDGWQDFYHGEFRGFGEVDTTSPAGDLTVDKYYATEGWNSSQSDAANYLAGHPYEEDIYQGNTGAGNTLLKQTLTTYAGTNSTSASCSTAYVAGYYKPCEVIPLTTKATLFEKTGTSNTNAPWTQQSNIYDDYNSSSGLVTGTYHNLTQEVTTSSNAPTITKNMTYATTNTTVSGWTYYTVHNLTHSELVDASGHTWQCQDTAYDEGASTRPAAGWPTTVTAYSTCGTASTAIKAYTGYDTNGNVVATVDGLEASNPSTFGSKGCTLSTAPVIFPTSSWSGTHYTSCTAYNATSALPTDTWNALMQHMQTSYDATQGLLSTGVTDVNSKVTNESYSYDSSGNTTTRMSEPGETSSAGYTKQGVSTSTCTDSSTLPCQEIDGNTSLYSSAITRTFYDSQGRKVETLSLGADASHSLVTFTVYNDATHSVFKSLPFRVASRTSWLDPNGATDDTGAMPGGTTVVLDALDATVSTTDPLSNQSVITYGLGTMSGDAATYALTITTDANQHVQLIYADALNRTRYVVNESGISGGTLTPVSKKVTQYDALDKVISAIVTDLAPQSGQSMTIASTTMQYDDLGRITTLNDPDRATHTYVYDADDHALTDVSGSRTIGTSYDLLGRIGCIQDAVPLTDGSGSCSSGSHPLVQNNYDTSVLGTAGTSDFPIGSLTQSIATTYYDPADYTNKTTVTKQYQHDQRGQSITSTMLVSVPSSWGVTTALPTYKQTQAYNAADQATTTQTAMGSTAGYAFSKAYDSTTGLLNGLSNNTTSAANLAILGYNGRGSVSDLNFQTSTVTQLATEHFDLDGNLRLAATTATWLSGSGSSSTIFSQGQAYDAVSNVITSTLTHAAISGQTASGGSELQNFCYDEQNRLLWAGNSGTQPAPGTGVCGSGMLANNISGASYSSTLAYTHLGQLWQGPLNGSGTTQQYLYCSSSHPHQLTGLYPTGTTCASLTGASYSASYDAWGNLTSRTTGGTTAALSYDLLDHLVTWNAGSVGQEWYAYDASGNRILRRSTTNSGTTLTTYAFGLEEHVYSSTGTNTNNVYYYMLAGRLIGEETGVSTLSTQFFLTDLLGSVLVAFSATAGSAVILGNQLYGPYGNQRYSKGTMGTAKGYTGQYSDSISGLDYYNARYYDPVIGRFLSPDTVQGNEKGMDPYAYVLGNPEIASDPTGHTLYYDQIVEDWYVGLELAAGNYAQTFNATPDSPDMNIPNFGLPSEPQGGLTNANLPSYLQTMNQYKDSGTGKGGRPDLLMYSPTQNITLIYDVKSGDYLDQGPSNLTLNKGFAQTWWYAYRGNQDTPYGLTNWAQGNLQDDVAYRTYMQTMPGCDYSVLTCTMNVPTPDGSGTARLDITYRGGGVISYTVNDTKQRYKYVQPQAQYQYSWSGMQAILALAAGAIVIGVSSGGGYGSGGGGGISFPPSGCSFSADTFVNQPEGEQAIGTLKVGDLVRSYNLASHEIHTQPIQHVWVHVDNDALDLTVTVEQPPLGSFFREEVLHTTKKHPFLTQEQGFVAAGQLHRGMHLIGAYGLIGVISDTHPLSGTKVMYNLEVAHDHTFLVGEGQWVVHNACVPQTY